MSFSFGAGVRDSLSNLAASLGAGKDKAAHDAFTVFDLGRAQIEAMYRGDWLARKVVDIVPQDLGSTCAAQDDRASVLISHGAAKLVTHTPP